METKKVEDMSTAELGLAYGKTVERIYQQQIQCNVLEKELNCRHESTPEAVVEEPEDGE